MAQFNLFKPTLKDHEGGWVDDPDDPGGATMMGVTLKTYRYYFGQHKTKDDLRNITDGEWTFIMKKFWDRCQGDRIRNQSVAEILVDWHVHSGYNAIKAVQRRFGLKADGIVGKQTFAALDRGDAKFVFDSIREARIGYYNKLFDTGKSHPKYRKGWMRRVNNFTFQQD